MSTKVKQVGRPKKKAMERKVTLYVGVLAKHKAAAEAELKDIKEKYSKV